MPRHRLVSNSRSTRRRASSPNYRYSLTAKGEDRKPLNDQDEAVLAFLDLATKYDQETITLRQFVTEYRPMTEGARPLTARQVKDSLASLYAAGLVDRRSP